MTPGFGRSPIQDAEDFAKKIGVEIVDKEIVALQALDATTQLLNMQKKNPDFAINQHTLMATSTILKDAKKLGLKNKFIGLNWAFSEKLIEMAGDASEGFMAPMPFAFWTETKVKGVQFMHKVRKEVSRQGRCAARQLHPGVHRRLSARGSAQEGGKQPDRREHQEGAGDKQIRHDGIVLPTSPTSRN